MSPRNLVLVLAFAAALSAVVASPATAGGHVAIVLTPPQPVTSPPSAYVPPPFLPGYPRPVTAPAPTAPLPPQIIYFTPPQAVPVVIPERGGHGPRAAK
jgi:hypothetical protein